MGALLEEEAGPEARYFDQLSRGRFVIQRCDKCEQAVFYPRTLCPHCGSQSLTWFQPSGHGVVYASTTIHTAADVEPFNVCLIDLDEGVRMMSRVVGMAPDAVRIGMRVSARVEGSGDAAKVVFERRQGI